MPSLPPNISIERATLNDLEIVHSILAANTKKGGHWDGWHTIQRVSDNLREKEVYLFQLENHPIGTMALSDYKSDTCSDDLSLFLTAFAILPEHHKKGFGQLLSQFADDQTLAKGKKGIFLHAFKEDETLQRFWRNLGYKIVGEIGPPVFKFRYNLLQKCLTP